jgi:hypothetical protein
MIRFNKIDAVLIVSFVSLIAFLLLYALRSLDDNTLTSWRWVFAQGSMPRVFALLALGALSAYPLSRTNLPERHPAPFLLALSFLVVVPFWGAPESVLDAGRYMLQAKHLEQYGVSSFFRQWGREVPAWTDLPVVPFFYGLIFRYAGEARLPIQVFTTLLFSLSVVYTYCIGKALWDRQTGFLAGLFLLGMPYLLTQVPLMLTDVPFLFLLTLSLYLYIRAVEKGGLGRIAAASAALVLAALAKYSAWPMLFVLPLVSAVFFRKGEPAVVLRSAAILAIAGLFSGAIVFAKYDVFMAQLDLLREYQMPGLLRWREGLASTFFFQIHPAVTLAALAALPLAAKNRDVRFLIPAWFAVFALVFQAGRIRYLLPLFPLLALMAAYGLAWLRDWELRKFIAWCAVAASLAIALGAYLPFLNRTSMANLRDAGAYLDTLPGETVLVRILPQTRSAGNTETAIPLLDLYTGKRLIYQQEQAARPADERIRTAPLRFTWEVRLSRFYAAGARINRNMPVTLISSEPPAPGFPAKTFIADTGTFRYKTFVTVFEQGRLAEKAQ